MHLAQQNAQVVDFLAVRFETRGDVFVEQLLHAEQALRQLLVLLVQRLTLFGQTLDPIGLLVVAHRADIRRDQQDWTCERRLETEQ